MKAADWDDQLLAEYRGLIRTEGPRRAFDVLVAAAIQLPGYDCRPQPNKSTKKDFVFDDPVAKARPFAFIINRKHLLFYVRKAGLKRVPGGIAKLKTIFQSAVENRTGEWKVYIRTQDEALRIINFLFGELLDAELASELADDLAEEALEQRTDIGPTQKKQLVNARRGQGIYKSNLMQIEKRCRVTGITERRYLRASHIKPWCASTDFEKLDGFNGLLLSPHVDLLFDLGRISFSDNGKLLLSEKLAPIVLSAWGIPKDLKVGKFRPEQCKYLAWHREAYGFRGSQGDL